MISQVLLVEIERLSRTESGELVIGTRHAAAAGPLTARITDVVLMRPDGSNRYTKALFKEDAKIVLLDIEEFEVPLGTRLFVSSAEHGELARWIE